MLVSDEYAIEYLTALTTTMKTKIEIVDSQGDEIRDREDLFVSGDDRLLSACLEKVIRIAKANILFMNKDEL